MALGVALVVIQVTIPNMKNEQGSAGHLLWVLRCYCRTQPVLVNGFMADLVTAENWGVSSTAPRRGTASAWERKLQHRACSCSFVNLLR